MNDTTLIAVFLLGLIPAFIAKSKGRNFWIWWLYGWAIFIVAFPHSLFLHRMKACPHCAESIKEEALICYRCGHDVFENRKPKENL